MVSNCSNILELRTVIINYYVKNVCSEYGVLVYLIETQYLIFFLRALISSRFRSVGLSLDNIPRSG